MEYWQAQLLKNAVLKILSFRDTSVIPLIEFYSTTLNTRIMKKNIFVSIIFIFLTFSYSIAQRKVLVEQFTNSGCPPCAANTPVVASYVNANLSNVLMLAYHTAFPYNDSMYYENSFQSDQRVAFYNVLGVPTSRVDGNFFSGNLVPSINTTILNAGAVSPRYNITFTTSNLNGNAVNATVMFESTDAANNGEPLKAMIVLAEKNVLKSSYACCAGNNSETEYPWVVRRMLPDENGTALVNTNLNGTDLVSVSWNTTNIKDYNELRIVAFVQNNTTKAIYQSEISTPAYTTGVNEINNTQSLFNILPNITNSNFTIETNSNSDVMQIKIIDVTGKIIYNDLINNNFTSINAANLQSGIYFVQASNQYTTETKKLIVVK